MMGAAGACIPHKRALLAALILAAVTGHAQAVADAHSVDTAAGQFTPTTVAAAGRVVGLPEHDSSDARPVMGGNTSVPAPTVVAPVTIHGEPRTFTVVSVPVPAALPVDQPVSYLVLQTGAAPLLGQTSGTIIRTSAPSQSILLTMAVPARARAGMVTVGSVRFLVSTGQSIEVPLRLEIASLERIEISAVQGLSGVRAGDAFDLSYRVTNLGNNVDTVDVEVILPPGWRSPDPAGARRVTLDVHGVSLRTTHITVPNTAGGDAVVRLIARAHGRPVATTDVPVEVLPPAAEAPTNTGPLLTLGASGVTGQGGSPLNGYSGTLDGQLTDDVHIWARATHVPLRADGGSLYAFSRAGYFTAPPALQLTSPWWALGVGSTGANLSELAGANVSGRGASLSVQRPDWGATVLLARPGDGGVDSVQGELTGIKATTKLGTGTVSTAVTHLVETTGFSSRSLDALTLGTTEPTLFDGVLDAEVAHRRYDGGAGLGWTTMFVRREANDNIDVRLTHAPGGSAAFARATDDFAANMSRSLGPLAVSGSVWRSSDNGNVTFDDIANRGWTAGTQVRLTRQLGVTLNVRQTSSSAASAVGRLTSDASMIESGVDVRSGILYGTGIFSVGHTVRETGIASGVTFVESAPGTEFRGAFGATGRYGTAEVTGRLSQSGGVTDVLPRQSELALLFDHVPLLSSNVASIYTTSSARRMSWFGSRSATTVVQAGLVADIPLGLSVGMSAEQNPFFLTMGGRSGWTYVLRVERTTRLPRLGRAETEAVVFKDLNGNGVRDGNEPGFPGIVVRCGNDAAVADKDGRARFLGVRTDSLQVDARSLPFGWVVSRVRTGTTGQNEIAVVALAAVKVRLVLADTQHATANLTRAVVIAHDTAGQSWVARNTSDGAVFDALPPGLYTTELDLSEVGEPLKPTSAAPTFRVDGTSTVPVLTIVLRPRPLKVNHFPASQ